MTKKQAIQTQIDNIMDNFEFDKVQTVMSALEGKSMDWDSIPNLIEIRDSARKAFSSLKVPSEEKSHYGFYVSKTEDKSYGKPWIRLTLHFGLNYTDDGIYYDE